MSDSSLASAVATKIVELVAALPSSTEGKADSPGARAQSLALQAATKTASVAGALSLPGGPASYLTIVPELLIVWQIQAQLVADTAAAYGRTAQLTREQMLYCLFRHTAAQVFRDVAVQVSERALVSRGSVALALRLAKPLGLKITERAVRRSVMRWVPAAGAVLVGCYAFWDTVQVGRTARAVFEGAEGVVLEGELVPPDAGRVAG